MNTPIGYASPIPTYVVERDLSTELKGIHNAIVLSSKSSQKPGEGDEDVGGAGGKENTG